jgi:antitoxin ParD1/3/4
MSTQEALTQFRPLKSTAQFIEQQISIGSYGTASDYISHLIRQEQERSAEKPLETLLIEGLDSGDPIEATEAWWTQKRADLVGRLHSFPS